MPREKIVNPILPGFNPDPSICRVGDDFYIATSTFEWYPGIQIFHSTDLRNWRLVSRPLNRPELLNMLGDPDSCGVWAPCLTWADGLFYLAYTDVKRFDGNFKDTPNFLTTCETIDGEWSDPVYLVSSGFDGSIFHDDDGKKWLVNMIWDHRAEPSFFRGIALQEYSVEERRVVGDSRIIFEGTDLDYTEAPHLYKRDGYYYLITAEGGTSYGHAVTMARSRAIEGPYEVDPAGPVVTSRNNPEWPLQRAGHADIVETQQGELYLVCLVSRPLPGRQLSPLGRETAIMPLSYTDDGWFRLQDGGSLPPLEIDAPALPPGQAEPEIERDDFDSGELDPVYQWLRTPWPDELMSLTDRPGYLRLYGMESPGSLFRQALVARRQTGFRFEAETCVDFEPDNFQQLAGLVVYYNSTKFHYVYVTTGNNVGKHIGVMSCNGNPSLDVSFPLKDSPAISLGHGPVWLRAVRDGDRLTFSWSTDGATWSELIADVDASALCDERQDSVHVHFTGTFVGVCCNDLTGMRKPADFDYFGYRNLD